MKRTIVVLAGLAGVVLPVAASANHRPGHGGAPGALSITATPNPVVFGRATTIAGRLSGANNAGRTVTLRADPHPFDGFQNLGGTTTNAQGDYAFRPAPGANTRYQVRQGNQESAVITVLVRIRTSLRLSDRTPRRGQRVRFRGSACPLHTGALVRIQRRARRGWRTVRRTRLRGTGACSTYSRRVRVYRDGRYRAVVAGDADHAAGISRRRRVDVH